MNGFSVPHPLSDKAAGLLYSFYRPLVCKRSIRHAAQQIPEQTVEKILDAAALLFLQKGYQNTTLQDIIDATKLSKGRCTITSAPRRRSRSVGDRLGDQMWEPLRHIRDDSAPDRAVDATGGVCSFLCRAAAAADRADLAAPVQQPAVPCHGLTNIEAHLAPECIAPMIRQGMADGSIHTANANALAEALFVLADIWLFLPRRAPPRRPSSGRGTSCFSK